MKWPVVVLDKDIVIGLESRGFYSRAGLIGYIGQRFATAATFLRSCVAQALSCGDRLRHSFHTSAYCSEYQCNEDLIGFYLTLLRVYLDTRGCAYVFGTWQSHLYFCNGDSWCARYRSRISHFNHRTGCSKSFGHILTLNILETKETKTYKKLNVISFKMALLLSYYNS